MRGGEPDVTAEEVIRRYGMARHPEGGWYREVHRSPALTAIHFLLPRGDFSAFHRLKHEEAWVHLAGAPLEMFLLGEEPVRRVLSPAGGDGAPVVVVPAGVPQAARSLGDYTLSACLVAPGFDFRDFSLPSREELTASFPGEAERIRSLTR
jgi:predicted cupin superfamily sugar epimerase